MPTNQRSHAKLLVVATTLALTTIAPLRAAAQEYAPSLAPAAAAWAASSGYDTLEANRAAASALINASAPEFGERSGYDALEAQRVAYSTLISAPESAEARDAYRVALARQLLATRELGGLQEAMMAELVIGADAAAMAWGEASGYNALEANRTAMSGQIGGSAIDIVTMTPPHHNP